MAPARLGARDLFDGPGEVRAFLRRCDWAATPLGPVVDWPQSLRIAVGLCLHSQFPMAIWWGPELTIIYNDAYRPIFGKRHPSGVGRPAREMWPETWAEMTPQLEAVLERGEATWNERRHVRTERNGAMEDAWFTWSFSPLFGEQGQVEGVCITTVEETEHVLRERELIATRDRLAFTLSAAEIGSCSFDARNGLVRADEKMATLFGVPAATAAAGVPMEVFVNVIHPEDRAQALATIEATIAHGHTYDAEHRLVGPDGAVTWVLARGHVVRDAAGQPISVPGVVVDITERKRAEQLVKAQNDVLRLIVTEASLAEILHELVRQVEMTGTDLVGSILLVDAEQRLRHGAAPSLPDAFNRAVDGVVIGANVGTCGRAAALGESVYTPDLAADSNWAMLRDEVAALGLLAAWSVPITSNTGKVVGTFGIYFRKKRGPTVAEKAAVDFLAKTAALSIERARVQEVLRESEERFRTLADNITQMAWIADGAGVPTWYNRRYFEYTGMTPDEVRAAGRAYIHHPAHATRVLEKFGRHVAQGQPWEDTFPLRREDGEYRWFLGRATPIRNLQGEVVRWFGTSTDITELREAQEKLRLSDARFRQIADTMPQIVWGAGPDGVPDYFNRRWFEYIGAPESDAAAAHWNSYIHPGDVAATGESWNAAVDSGTNYQTEFRLRGPGDLYRWFLTRALPIRDADGKIVRWFGTCTDINDRKTLAEENLAVIERERAARFASENAGRMKDDFLATLSHELRTPLNPVLLLASESAANVGLPAEVRADFETISKNVLLEARLIDDLLDVTKITRGKMALNIETADLNEILRDAIATVQPEIEEKGIRLTANYGAATPMVNGDSVRLQQVFWNILRNAAKFTPKGGTISLGTVLAADGERVAIRICDNGMGMTAEEQENLFNAFVQGDHAGRGGSHRFGGLGLGLAISRMLVEMHSGRISGTSEGPGKGAVFSVELPIAGELRSQAKLKRVLPVAVQSAGTATRPSRVLLVEDHEPTRTSLAHLLQRRHYEVFEAASCAEGLKIAQQHRCDLLITDIGLPDGDGYGLMQAVREKYIPQGIALTGYGMEEDIARSRQAGFATHLTKPVRVQALDAALATAANSLQS